jgi:predicted ATPase
VTTLLFTDAEGSTRLLHELGDGYPAVLAEHRRVLREAFGVRGGAEADTQGDAFFFTFDDARQAVAAANEAQAALSGGPVRVRMGLHTGEPTRTEEGWVGIDVHLGARVAAAGHGGQVLLTKATRDLVDSVPVRDLGEHRVKDFDEAVWIFQLGDEAFPPLRTISNTNLPRPASSFVGREREVDEVGARVRDSHLVTLTGPGGSGKTRLAIEAAAELVGEFKNGVFWVPLAAIRDSELVLPTIEQTLGAQTELAEHVGERELLLLLDNLEQVVDVAPELADLVEACPNLNLLVTSRELLRVRGEVEYEVLPLAGPDAVELFTARAQLEPTEAIEELCRRLDNLPLALELAAARTNALTPEQILERLAQRLDLFKGGRDAETRQTTLRATIEWSHQLLSPGEQRLFARLGAFAGGCTLEAAQQIADADLDLLQSLVEKSLVRHTGDRFWMLETIREYAVERLEESGIADDIRRRHAEVFAGIARSTCLAVERIEDGEMRYDVAFAEQDNMRAAIDWALDHDPELGLRIAVELEQFWISKDPAEGRRRFAALFERAHDLPLDLEAAALRVFGGTAQVSGDTAHGRELYAQSLEAYERLGDEWGIIHGRYRVATSAVNFDHWELARELTEENLIRARALGSRYLETEMIGMLANLEAYDGNLEHALELAHEHVRLSREIGFAWFEAGALSSLAEMSFKLGRFDDADEHARAALKLYRKMEDRRFGTYPLAAIAVAANARGDLGKAGRLWGALEAEHARTPPTRSWQGYFDELREILPAASAEFDSGVAEGRRLSWEDALEYAVAGRNEPVRESGEVKA